MFALFAVAILAANSGMTESNKFRILLFAMSSFFWGPGLAVYITGYRWKNLAPGNRGPHKSEDSKAYRNALIGYFAGASALLILAILRK